MRTRTVSVLVVAVGLLSCDDAIGPRKLRIKAPHIPKFMQVEVDPTCNYVSETCAYVIGGVTTYGGGSNNPPPLIIWPDWSPDAPSIYEWMAYPGEGEYSGYNSATVGSNEFYLQPGGVVAERACDPNPYHDPDCLIPLQPRDSVFLTTLLSDLDAQTLYFRGDGDLMPGENADQCAQMRGWLRDLIYNTFNRPEGNREYGIFRGRNGVGTLQDIDRVHGGATWGKNAHADEREWEIYAADSISMRTRLARTLIHEAVHVNGYMHGWGTNPDYAGYPYFKYLIRGDRRSCVRG